MHTMWTGWGAVRTVRSMNNPHTNPFPMLKWQNLVGAVQKPGDIG